MKTSIKSLLIPALACAAAIAVFSLPSRAEIQTAKGGAQGLLNAPSAVALVAAEMDKTGMPCPKCHDELATTVSTSRGGVKEYRTVERHVCGGCATRLEATGHGKAKTETVIHTCSYAPDKGAACCK